MRPRLEQVPPSTDTSWRLFTAVGRTIDVTWHYHPEFEVTLIDDGWGRRLVGDGGAGFTDGDLVLLGPGLPHAYVSDPASTSYRVVVAQFRHDVLGGALTRSPEFEGVSAMLDRSTRGLAFPDVPDRMRADFRRLASLAPARRTLALLTFLVDLSELPSQPLASPLYATRGEDAAQSRLDLVCTFLREEHTRPVGLAEVARIASMSPSGFSRFFSRQMGRTLTSYLTALRVETACRLLLDTDRPVADVAADSGFANLAWFNRCFRRSQGCTPREFRDTHGPRTTRSAHGPQSG